MFEILHEKIYQNKWQHFGDAVVMLLEQEKESAYKIIRQYKWDLDKNG